MGDPSDIRKRIEALNREALPPESADARGIRRKLQRAARERTEPPADAVVYRRDLPRSSGPLEHHRPTISRHVVLEEAVDGAEVDVPPHGKAFQIVDHLAEHDYDWEPLFHDFRAQMLGEGSSLRTRLRRFCDPTGWTPADVVFMDLESTGLAGTPLFLIGTMGWEDGGLVVRQYLARDYSEERAVIRLFLDLLTGGRLLVTFNGKSFDLPYVRVRAAATGLRFAADVAHLDLLHECRRAWRHALPDCRLQTLERRICGRPRMGDIPGEQIPAAYHEYVRTGNAAEIVDILRHNVLDLVTLAELMVKLPPVGG